MTAEHWPDLRTPSAWACAQVIGTWEVRPDEDRWAARRHPRARLLELAHRDPGLAWWEVGERPARAAPEVMGPVDPLVAQSIDARQRAEAQARRATVRVTATGGRAWAGAGAARAAQPGR